MTARVLVLAPTRRARTETFVRANLARLPFAVEACFGDEIPWREHLKALYGLAVLDEPSLRHQRCLWHRRQEAGRPLPPG